MLYAGLMVSPEGKPNVVEFNCRFGDPETQPLLMRLATDLVEIAEATVDERLDDIELEWHDAPAVCVVMASGGYPGSYEKGKPISGLGAADGDDSVVIFHAGTADQDGEIVTSGGRVLGITAMAPDLKDAIDKAYAVCDQVSFGGAYLRRDIGKKALDRMV